MRKLLAVAVIGLIILPLGALASHSNCSHVNSQEHKLSQNGVFVYADTNGSSGTSGSADQAAGVCADQGGTGGTIEAGHTSEHGTTYGIMPGLTEGGYIVADGGNGNPDPGDGYIGVSNFEREEPGCVPKDTPPPNYCSTNGGGRFGLGGGPYAPVEAVPIICGNTTGGSWDDTNRDGCEVP